jgi:peptide deformylase
MSAKEILVWPDPALLKVSERVEKIDESIYALVEDLKATMEYEGNSAGLAAPQIGVHKRVFVVDIPPEDNDGNGTNGPEAFINPEFILKEGKLDWDESCMSIPGERGRVIRSNRVIMRYTDLEGKEREVEAFSYLAGCFQHENDHLDGKLWIDYQSNLKRNLVRKKMLKYKKRV